MRQQRALLNGTGTWAEDHRPAYQLCSAVGLVDIVGHNNEPLTSELAERFGIAKRWARR